MAAFVSEQPPRSILARLDRLDIMLGHLEELRGGSAARSPATSTTTMSSGGAVTSDGGNSSVDSSPKSIGRRRCRPIGDVVVESRIKGNLIDRVEHLEIRLLKLEEEIELEKKTKEGGEEKRERNGGEKRTTRGKGLKRLVESCVKGDIKTKE